ncbi:MAG: hypothetical protein WCK01_00825 [Candidatus Uhrbacteria bacterium]|jgi:hypothetical protein
MSQRLVLVYNADAGIPAACMDAYKRVMNDPTTCRLYRLTHGYFFERRAWSDFLARIPQLSVYAHREYSGLRGAPCVMREQDGEVTVILTSEQIDQCKDVLHLIKTIEGSLLTSFAE